jgi:hypothetical protein
VTNHPISVPGWLDLFSLMDHQFIIWDEWAGCPGPQGLPHRSPKQRELLPEPPAPRTAPPPPLTLLRRRRPALLWPQPSLPAPPLALPCCAALSPPLLLHQKWRPSPRTSPTLPEDLKNEWILWWYICYSLLLMLSDAPTTTIMFWFMWVILHRGWFISINICVRIWIYGYIYRGQSKGDQTRQPGWWLVIRAIILSMTSRLVDLCGGPDDWKYPWLHGH